MKDKGWLVLTSLGVSDLRVRREGRICLLTRHIVQELGERLVLLPGLRKHEFAVLMDCWGIGIADVRENVC